MMTISQWYLIETRVTTQLNCWVNGTFYIQLRNSLSIILFILYHQSCVAINSNNDWWLSTHHETLHFIIKNYVGFSCIRLVLLEIVHASTIIKVISGFWSFEIWKHCSSECTFDLENADIFRCLQGWVQGTHLLLSFIFYNLRDNQILYTHFISTT